MAGRIVFVAVLAMVVPGGCGDGESEVAAAPQQVETAPPTSDRAGATGTTAFAQLVAETPYFQSIDYSVPPDPGHLSVEGSEPVRGRRLGLSIAEPRPADISEATEAAGLSPADLLSLRLDIAVQGGDIVELLVPVWQGPAEVAAAAQSEHVEALTQMDLEGMEVLAVAEVADGQLRPTSPSSVVVGAPGEPVEILGAPGVAATAWGATSLDDVQRRIEVGVEG